jgi:hypothetical protein
MGSAFWLVSLPLEGGSADRTWSILQDKTTHGEVPSIVIFQDMHALLLLEYSASRQRRIPLSRTVLYRSAQRRL